MEKTSMEQVVIKLLKMNFDLDDFYSITIHPDHHAERIFLQGQPSAEKLFKYTKLGFNFSGDEDKFVATNNRIRITLY